jgi:transketolase
MQELIEKDERICYITCDAIMEKSNMRALMEKYPYRVVDVGIAEQNAVDIAVGMSLVGKKAFVVTVSSFVVLKTLEQIHTNIAYSDVPVRLIASNSGTTAGPTHDAICDYGILNTIPNMIIIIPSCTYHLIKVIEATIEFNKPIFYKIPQYVNEKIYMNYLNDTFEVGKALIVCDGNDASIIAIGVGVTYAYEAASELLKENIHVRVIDMISFKPIDREVICRAALETGLIITVEEHNICGGLGTRVADVLAEENVFCRVVKMGIEDEFNKVNEKYSIYYKYTKSDLISVVKKYIK